MIQAGKKIRCTECGTIDEPLIAIAHNVCRCTRCAYQIAMGKRPAKVFVAGDPEVNS